MSKIKKIFLVAIPILFLGTMIIFNQNRSEKRFENGVYTRGKILSSQYVSYVTSEYGGELVRFYKINYAFNVESTEYNGYQEIQYGDIQEYFKSTPKKGDAITVIYEQSNPLNSQIIND